jgi:hypothetical protein
MVRGLRNKMIGLYRQVLTQITIQIRNGFRWETTMNLHVVMNHSNKLSYHHEIPWQQQVRHSVLYRHRLQYVWKKNHNSHHHSR